MPDAAASLTELVFRVKDAFESADMMALGALFAPRARVHVLGTSLPVEEFTRQLGELLARVDRPRLELVRVEETAIGRDGSVLTCAAEVSLVDRRTQHLGTVPGILTIRAAFAAGDGDMTDDADDLGRLLITELTFRHAAA
jgi:hypothetical protein